LTWCECGPVAGLLVYKDREIFKKKEKGLAILITNPLT
jgi:hypothetical protein